MSVISYELTLQFSRRGDPKSSKKIPTLDMGF